MRRFLLGTDWWTDCDDAIALRLLCQAIKKNEIRLEGIAINACMEDSVASLKGFLIAEGVAPIPVGIDLDATDYEGEPPYQHRLAKDYAPTLTNADAEDPVRLYRRLLAASEEKLEILEIGFLQVIAAVLKSGPDDLSPKSGIELVRDKVKKFWVMAGKWDADGECENNFCSTPRSRVAGKEFCELCPVPVTFLGWEISFNLLTGGKLRHDDVLYRVLVDHGSQGGRHSWDPMLVMLALIGDEKEAGYDTVTGHASVDEATGANHFTRNPDGMHTFVVKNKPNKYYTDQIDALL